jgi:hypothetical protein
MNMPLQLINGIRQTQCVNGMCSSKYLNDDAIKANVEEVTRAIGVNFQANAQDVTLSLVSYNGDKSVKTLTISAPFG